jgi:hypothetical protein
VRLKRIAGQRVNHGTAVRRQVAMPLQPIWMAFRRNNMFVKKVLVSAVLAAGMIGAAVTPLSSVAEVSIELNFGPPAVRYEAVPAARSGYVWSPGHWQYNGNTHVWAAGNWQTARTGYVYYAPRWVERSGRWSYQPSRWDRDGDGIPNRRDADRDGDGVPNRRDAAPNNPNFR